MCLRTRRLERKRVQDLIAALKQCSKNRDLAAGKTIHRQVVERGFFTNILVANTLVRMYTKCRSMELAWDVFKEMTHKDVVTWSCLILGYVENGEISVALDTFSRMECQPDHVTCLAALKACAVLASEKELDRQILLEKGIAIHEQIKQHAYDTNIVVTNTLIDMYSKCGSMRFAREVFERMVNKDVVTWNCLIQGYVESGDISVALELFTNMECEPNHVTYLSVLKACARLANESALDREIILEKGRGIHEKIKEKAFDSNVSVASTLIDMYSKCRSMELAREVFDRMIRKDVVTWNCLLLGYVENGESWIALELFNSMDCEPNCVTCVTALKACTRLVNERELDKQMVLEKGMAIHRYVKKSAFVSSILVGSALVEMYSKCGSMHLAREVFEGMIHKDVVTWTCLILGYVENAESSVALDLFTSMDCKPDQITYVAALKACTSLVSSKDSEREFMFEKAKAIHEEARKCAFDSNLAVASALVEMYSKCKNIHLASQVFQGMVHKDVVTWTSLIMGYVENGESSLALDLFFSMDCEPTIITYTAALKACKHLAELPLGRAMHCTVSRLGYEEDISMLNVLVDFYGRCGCMATAVKVFDSMHSPDIVSWNALLTGYSSIGNTSQLFSLLSKIKEAGLEFNATTYICILTACSHAGMVEEGEIYFKSMHKHGVIPTVEHYTCMVDMLGRANKFAEAVSTVNRMPFKCNEVTWMTLLHACKKWNNVEVGKVAFDELVSGRKQHSAAAYVLMSDIYGSSGY